MKTFAAVLSLFVMLTACGQTGDLYWPAEEEQTVVDEDEDAE